MVWLKYLYCLFLVDGLELFDCFLLGRIEIFVDMQGGKGNDLCDYVGYVCG